MQSKFFPGTKPISESEATLMDLIINHLLCYESGEFVPLTLETIDESGTPDFADEAHSLAEKGFIRLEETDGEIALFLHDDLIPYFESFFEG